MLVCRKCKKFIMYSVRGYCEECIPPLKTFDVIVHGDSTIDASEIFVALDNAFAGNVKYVQELRPTPLAPDAGDSAVSTSSLQASADTTSQAESAPTQRG